MGRMHVAPFIGRTLAANTAQNIWSLMASANNKLRLHGWDVTSADVAAEAIECYIERITGVGSGGNAETEGLIDEDDHATIEGSVRTADTTPGTPGTAMFGFEWEQLGPLGLIYTPEMRPTIKVSQGIALTVDNSQVGCTFSGWVCWEEI